MLLKCWAQYVSKFGKLISGHRPGKVVFILISKKYNAKERSNYCTNEFISHASRVMLQARLQQYVNWELPDVQVRFRQGRGTRDQSVNILWIIVKEGNSSKTSIFASLTTLKPLTMWITTNYGIFLKRWEYQTTLLVFSETCMWVKKQ